MCNGLVEYREDTLRANLLGSLFRSFKLAGYDDAESEFLAGIAIGPVDSALQLAQAAYKLHIEALETREGWVTTVNGPGWVEK